MTKLPKMNKVEMVRSDISGKLFPVSDCEVVIVKIIKGKKEDINAYSPFNSTKGPVTEDFAPAKTFRSKETTGVVVDPESEEYNKAVHKNTSVIPPSMRDIFQKPPELQS